MIKYLHSQYVDLKKYDQCVKLHQPALPYAYSWYLNAVCDNWDCLVLNDYDAVWPLPVRRKWGIKYFYRPVGIQQLGIYTKKSLTDEQLESFIAEMQRQCQFAELFLNEAQGAHFPTRPNLDWRELPNLVLYLERPYQEIYGHYTTNLKRKLRKLEKAKLNLFESDGPEILLDLFEAHKGAQLKLPKHFYRDIKKLMFQCFHKGLAKVYTVYGGPNMLLAGAFFLEVRGRSTFLFSAVSPEGRDLNAMAYLINEYIIYHSEKLQYLDFEGSQATGLARFYSSFGAQNRPYYFLKYNGLPWPISKMK